VSKPLNPALRGMHNFVGGLLDQAIEFAERSSCPMPKVTMLMRDPGNDDAVVIVSNDDLGEVGRVVRLYQAGQSRPGQIVVHEPKVGGEDDVESSLLLVALQELTADVNFLRRKPKRLRERIDAARAAIALATTRGGVNTTELPSSSEAVSSPIRQAAEIVLGWNGAVREAWESMGSQLCRACLRPMVPCATRDGHGYAGFRRCECGGEDVMPRPVLTIGGPGKPCSKGVLSVQFFRSSFVDDASASALQFAAGGPVIVCRDSDVDEGRAAADFARDQVGGIHPSTGKPEGWLE